MTETNDNRSKDFIFLPFCLMAQAFHAQGLVKYEWKGAIRPVLDEVMNKDINIVQMPCPESLFPNLEKGLVRAPLSYSKYNTKDFRAHCRKLANDVAEQISAIISNGYRVIGVIGIENSPSCAVNLQYTNKGNVNLSGVYIQELKKILKERKLDVPFLGINRRGIGASIKRLKKLLSSTENSIALFD